MTNSVIFVYVVIVNILFWSAWEVKRTNTKVSNQVAAKDFCQSPVLNLRSRWSEQHLSRSLWTVAKLFHVWCEFQMCSASRHFHVQCEPGVILLKALSRSHRPLLPFLFSVHAHLVALTSLLYLKRHCLLRGRAERAERHSQPLAYIPASKNLWHLVRCVSSL